jgi:hypothetical protein
MQCVSKKALQWYSKCYENQVIWGGGALFRLRNVTIVGFYYLVLLKLLHVSVVRPFSSRNIRVFATIYSKNPRIVKLRRWNKPRIIWISHTQQDANTLD